ncbi:MAG: glycosyltransferase family 39 protein [Deltaproteobacteria bacterium]|nr:glycosyltransferase family 39 protein [Deltaproteobacteria bacterium]
MAPPLRDTSWAALGTLALAKLALHLATSTGYGHFRDELYYLASTEHLAWGYVEHPPLSIALLWLARTGLGESLLALRCLPALAGAATVIVTGLLARELGGGSRAQFLAALSVLVTPFYLAVGHFYSMNVFDVLLWATLGWLAARILLRSEPRLWLVFGLVAGIGLLNKVSVGFLGFGLVVGLALTPQRRWFSSPWLWLGGGIAFVVFLPHLFWQIQHDWPTLEFQANARADKNPTLSPFEFAAQQFQLGNPVLLPLWLTGLGGLLASRRLAAVRPLGIAYAVLFVLFVATTAKAYYLAPIYTILFAAGAVISEPVLARRTWRMPVAAAVAVFGSLPALPVALPVLSQERFIAYSRAIGLEAPVLERHEQGSLPQNLADMHGWRELVDTVERVVASLAPEERRRAVVLATNYGEAGAVEVLGRHRGLPPVVCGHNSYWEWRPATLEGPVIALRRSREELERWFESVERVDTVRCRWCMPYQKDAPVHVARGLKVPLEQFWREIKRFI